MKRKAGYLFLLIATFLLGGMPRSSAALRPSASSRITRGEVLQMISEAV